MKNIITFCLLFIPYSIIQTAEQSKRSCINSPCSTISLCQDKTKQQYLSLTQINRKTKNLCSAGCWNLVQGGTFNPLSSVQSSPMIKIIGSAIELNFNGTFIQNGSTTQEGWIGIEVGYTPAELAADPTLTQPKDIVIRNVHLKNFDCGILVHKGVKRVLIQDSVILESSLGIVMLGNDATFAITCPTTAVTPDPDDRISCAGIVNCKIIGHEQNRRDALVNLKTRLETTYGYDTDYFMPLRADRIAFPPPATTTALDRDVYTYSGILASHIENLLISCTTIQCTGNSDFAAEGAGTRTEAIGIIVRDSDEVSVEHTKTVSTYGNVKATGMQLERVCGVNIYDSEFSYATSDFIASGIESFPDSLAKTLDSICSGFDFTLEEADLCEVKTEFQRSADIANGIYITDTRGLNGQDVFAQRNIATNSSLGLSSITSVDITFTDSSFTRNFAGAATTTLKSYKKPFSFASPKRSLGSLGTNDGIYAIGFFAEQTNNITCNNINCDSNIGENSGRGMQLIACQSCSLQNSSFTNNQGTTKRINEDTLVRAAQDIQEISRGGPAAAEVATGGYGLIIQENSSKIMINQCNANHNNGHRSAGITIKDGQQILIDQSSSSYNFANGDFMNDDIVSFNVNNVPFPVVQQQLFAGNACAADQSINQTRLGQVFRRCLNQAREIREDQIRNGIVFANARELAAGISLASASIARFRLWGTAFGIQLHNCNNFLIQNCTANAQQSTQDSAIGLLISGRSSEFEVLNNHLSYNDAWTNSIQTFWQDTPNENDQELRYQYDLSALKDLWYFLSGRFATGWSHAATTSDIGFFTGVGKGATDPPDVMIAQGEQEFGDTTTPNGLPNVFLSNGGGDRHVIHFVGPAGVGIHLSDVASFGYIANNTIQSNYAHAGFGSGIFFNTAYNINVSNNDILHNGANIYGFGIGIIDCTNYSVNIFHGNFFSQNKLKKFMNSNFIVPMGNIGGQSFQSDTLENGLYDRLERSLQNSEINIPLTTTPGTPPPHATCTVESTLDGAVPTEIINVWTTNSWIA